MADSEECKGNAIEKIAYLERLDVSSLLAEIAAISCADTTQCRALPNIISARLCSRRTKRDERGASKADEAATKERSTFLILGFVLAL